jgi:hypothetical protein
MDKGVAGTTQVLALPLPAVLRAIDAPSVRLKLHPDTSSTENHSRAVFEDIFAHWNG